MKHVGIEIKFYNLDTFKKQIDVNFIDLDSNLVDLNYKVTSLIFCHVWRSIVNRYTTSEAHMVLALASLCRPFSVCVSSHSLVLRFPQTCSSSLYGSWWVSAQVWF